MMYYLFIDDKTIEYIGSITLDHPDLEDLLLCGYDVDETNYQNVGSITIGNPYLSTLKKYGYDVHELTFEAEPPYDTVNEVLEIRFKLENDKIVQYFIILPANNDIEMP